MRKCLVPLGKLKRFAQGWLVPPRVTAVLVRCFRKLGQPTVPSPPEKDPLDEYWSDGWTYFRQALAGAKVYLEYGAGSSTEFVSREYSCSIRSVETSEVWCSVVRNRIGTSAHVVHVDLGETGDWGRPLTYRKRDNFITYFEAGFENGYSPDTILIDGRFRVACFLTSLLHASPGTLIVFDDYPDRPHYHVVEEMLEPLAVNQRQAIFERPKELDLKQVRILRDQFGTVME